MSLSVSLFLFFLATEEGDEGGEGDEEEEKEEEEGRERWLFGLGGTAVVR